MKDVFIFRYHTLDFVQQKKTKFTMEQPCILPILYRQCHACWCPGNLRSKYILWISTLPERCSCNLKSMTSFPFETALGWMPKHLTDEESPLFQVTAWCHQATTHKLIPKPMLMKFHAIYLSFIYMSLETIISKLQPHIPGANELKQEQC